METQQGRRRFRTELIRGITAAVILGGSLLLFFALMSVHNWPLKNLSRTTATTLVTFGAMGCAMMAVYGWPAPGEKPRRQLICAQTLGIMATDAVTYLQLQIMNVNPNNNDRLILFGEDFPLLLACMALQALLITLTALEMTALHHRLNPPLRTLLVLGDESRRAMELRRMKAARSRWRIDRCLMYDDPDMEEALKMAEAVVLSPEIPGDARMGLLQRCYMLRRTVLCRPTLEDVLLSGARREIVDDAPFLMLEAERMTLTQRLVKRLMDVGISLTLLALLSPAMLVIALLIRLEDGGKALFHQQRLTLDGRRFTITKFRTMRPGAENGPSARQGDGRITRIGGFLRRWRLDELPQLWNILRGDMSLVGPRPEMLSNVERYKQALPGFVCRERMKAGLTGYAQIEGRYSTSPEDKLLLDLMYIEHFSIWEDVKLLLRTLTVFFRPDSASGFPDVPQDESLQGPRMEDCP